MKRRLIIFIVSLFSIHSWCQDEVNKYTATQIKIEFLELGYTFPRLGIGLEREFMNYNFWSSFHYGWEGLSTDHLNNYFDGEYNFWGVRGGANKVYPSGPGAYLLGGQIEYDQTRAQIEDDVFYNLAQNSAVLFDRARYHRSRIGLFLQNGYELNAGRVFSIEFSSGIGVRRITRNYIDVENAFALAEVEPREIRSKTMHKYAGASWRFALTGAIKLGFRFPAKE